MPLQFDIYDDGSGRGAEAMVSFDINKEDYWEFNIHVVMNNLKYKRRFLISLILLPIVMSVIFMLMQLPAWYSWTAGMILGLAVHVYSYKRFKRRVLSLVDDKPGLLGEHMITLADEGIIESTSVNESIHKWGGIRAIEHNEGYIFIFLNQTMAHIIPKRAFASPETAAVFLKEAQSRWESQRTA